MIRVDTKERIRELHFREGYSIRAISRMLKVARKTVKRALADAEPPRYHLTKERTKRVIGPFLPIIYQLLEEDQLRPPKQRHTARRIFERLRDEYGYQGSEATVRLYVSRWRQAQPKEIFLPMDFGLNGWAQSDWFEALVELQGTVITVHVFLMRLCGSRALFARTYLKENAEAILDAHVHSFNFFGGVPPHIAYDNPKTLVAQIFSGRRRKESQYLQALRLHYLFQPEFCLPYEAHEKGLAENAVRLVRHNFFVPIPKVNSLEELNEHLERWCLTYLEEYLPDKEATVGELLAKEKLSLLPLPEVPFEPAVFRSVRATRQAFIHFDGNRYSVPVNMAHLPLTLRAYVDRIEIYHEDEKIAVHTRCYAQGKTITCYTHYLPLLKQKPNYVLYTLLFRQLKLPAPLEQFLNKLATRSPKPPQDIVACLELMAEHGIETVAEAAERALLMDTVNVTALKALLPIPSGPKVEVPGDLRDYRVHMPHPAKYDRLLGGAAV